MKLQKTIAIVMMALCTSMLMADVLVYDFTATFKDLATKVTKVSTQGVKFKLDTAKVQSDKFTGFVLVEACKECSDTDAGTEATADFGKPGTDALVYIVRQKGVKGAVYRSVGNAYINMFGGKAGYSFPLDDYVYTNTITDASMRLTFGINFVGQPGDNFDGYMGRGSYTSDDLVRAYGFGKVQKLKALIDGGECFEDQVTYCYALKTLSGNILGAFNYTGCCSDYIFDLCGLQPGITCPINGTFVLKFNKSMSVAGKSLKNADFAAAEQLVLNKMNVKTLYHNPAETEEFEAEHEVVLAPAEEWIPSND